MRKLAERWVERVWGGTRSATRPLLLPRRLQQRSLNSEEEVLQKL